MRQFRALSGVALVALLVGCGGGSDAGPPVSGGPPPPGGLPPPASAPPLKTNLAARYGVVNFPVGAAIEPLSTTNADRDVLLKHFSSITAENVMKPATVWPNAPGTSGSTAQPATQPNFVPADTLADFALNNGIQLRGHTLLWHQSAPEWFFAGDVSEPINYRINVQQRLRTYIFAVVQRYPSIYAWDVVNEVATDAPNPVTPYRTNSDWYIAYSVGGQDGSEYVRDAFMFASQARASIGRTSATMKLMLNDYNTELPGQTRQRARHRAGPHRRRHPHRRRRAPVSPAARCGCQPGDRGVHGRRSAVEHVRESRDRARRVHLPGSG